MELNEKTKILEEPSTGANTPTEVTSDTYQLIDAQDGAGEDRVKRSTLPMATFNFINSIIGSGIIGMPYALKQAGVGLGIILIILVAIITDYSVMLLIHGGQISNTNSYQGLVQSAFGRPGFFILTIMQFLYPFIAMISYNVIIGDTITKVMLRFFGYYISGTIVGTRHFVIVVVTLLVLLPVSLYRDIAKLAVASLTAMAFVVFILVAMIIRIDMSSDIPITEDSWQFANYNFTQAIGVMAFAYMCLHNSFLIYDSLEDPTWHKWHIVTHASMLTSMVLMVILGIVGYATFTSFTQGDVLENYCEKDDLINAARLAFAVTIMLTYPVECFVTREVLEHSVFAHYQPRTLWRHSLVTVIIVCLAMGFSMATDCLGVVLELNGVLAAAPLAFIIPPACVMKLQHEPVLCIKNIPMLLTTTFGIFVMGTGTAMVIKEMVNGYSCSHGEKLAYCQAENMTGLFTNQSVLTTTLRV
ncbi:putative sodium-coupled neutral amino acid transporter 11 [Lingula anatina]|uniref:Putative sodium-coupled neutral amino acid transporter 11 n=1 Tax=Lingula anatina TaxID=7574 RepID=A0A2R2MTV5_LINAN|nr:putative sodium-coupled neutral amino acid transporter 11 [Lingula anatina]|eukprot:XP_023933710.1 putative sodium-coupled neutral amino acid transporter 11 [Lingula anatina]